MKFCNMSLIEALDTALQTFDLYFESDVWKQKIKELEKRDEMQLQILAEINVISQKMTALLKKKS